MQKTLASRASTLIGWKWLVFVWPKEKPSLNTTAKAVFLVDTQHMAWHEGISINPL